MNTRENEMHIVRNFMPGTPIATIEATMGRRADSVTNASPGTLHDTAYAWNLQGLNARFVAYVREGRMVGGTLTYEEKN
jgi:hypothetical protein